MVTVSHATSPRREGLLWAAELTGVDVAIPDQPKWTETDLMAFRSKRGSQVDRGSALAWMGHVNALKWYAHPLPLASVTSAFFEDTSTHNRMLVALLFILFAVQFKLPS